MEPSVSYISGSVLHLCIWLLTPDHSKRIGSFSHLPRVQTSLLFIQEREPPAQQDQTQQQPYTMVIQDPLKGTLTMRSPSGQAVS